MRLAVLSDIHGNVIALEAVLRELAALSPDAIVNLGDCVTSPLWPRETFEILDAMKVPTVRGNHDRLLVERPLDQMTPSMRFAHDALTPEQRTFLAALPKTLALERDILAVHGTPASDTEYLLNDAVDDRLALATPARVAARLGDTSATLVLCGHSHHQHACGGPNDCVIVNPGAIGCPRYADNEDVSRTETGSPHARFALVTRRRGRWSVDLKVLDYDWSPVIARARTNHRDDFASAFLAHRGSRSVGSRGG